MPFVENVDNLYMQHFCKNQNLKLDKNFLFLENSLLAKAIQQRTSRKNIFVATRHAYLAPPSPP
jgi:hypothetical protein